jgi:hypothetical protein
MGRDEVTQCITDVLAGWEMSKTKPPQAGFK